MRCRPTHGRVSRVDAPAFAVSLSDQLKGTEPVDEQDLLRSMLQKPPKDVKHVLSNLSRTRFQSLCNMVLTAQRQQRKENQLAFYKPVSAKALEIHRTNAKVVFVSGGNRASKTDTCLAELAACATGVFPDSIREVCDIREKFRGPISVRVVVESLTTTLHPTILPKLQWWHWNGSSEPGGEKGHWGWIPRNHLVAGSWQRSWSEKLRTLTVICRDPDTNAYLGESKFQFMSHDQDPSDFASGEFHMILHDEPPSYAIWRENQARTISVGGRMFLAMTWPDDPAIAVDWIFDEVYDRALRGEDGYYATELWSTDNPHIDQQALEFQRKNWSQKTIDVRLYGKPIRFSNRIHPLFTDDTEWWCFTCGDTCHIEAGRCAKCDSANTTEFTHVRSFEPNRAWPTFFVLDPHPRKPHMAQWWQVDPQDDLWMVAEAESDGGVEAARDEFQRVESELGLSIARRLIDPNMGRSSASARNRNLTWQDEFDLVGIRTDLADDSDAGRSRVNDYLQPDPRTLRPRITIHPRCSKAIFQFKRYVWDDYREKVERDLKQQPKPKNDDHPTMAKYLLNASPEFRSSVAPGILRRRELPRSRYRTGQMWVNP